MAEEVTSPSGRKPSRRFSAHIGYMFSELEFEDRFAAAADAGFSLVEHPAPYGIAASRVRELLDINGLGFAQLAFPSGDAAKGEKGLACLPGREADFRAAITPGLDFAATIRCRHIHVQSGVTPAHIEPAAVWETYVASLAYAADAAAWRGLTILIEAIGAATLANYYLSNPYTAVSAVQAAGKKNIRLLFDVFHALNDGIDPFDFIRTHANLIAHLHIADHPGRHEPGTGRIDFEALFSTLDEAGYIGAIGCEYIPQGDTRAGLGWMDRYS